MNPDKRTFIVRTQSEQTKQYDSKFLLSLKAALDELITRRKSGQRAALDVRLNRTNAKGYELCPMSVSLIGFDEEV